jgi:predicted ATP-grasp superfamily ATP-dependent carboligase
MTSRHIVIASALAAWLVAALHVGPPFAFVIVGWFMLTCPGAPFVRLLDVRDPLPLIVFTVGASIAVDALVSEALFYAHIYTSARAVGVLAVFVILGSYWPRRERKAPPPPVLVVRPERSEAPSSVPLDPELPALLIRIGRYPVYHGAVGAIRSLGRAGVPVYAIVEDRLTPAASSRYLTRPVVWPTTGREREDDLVEGLARIGRKLGGGVLALPTDDEAAVLLAEHGDVLREWFVYPDIEPSLPRRLASKRGLFQICRMNEVATPYAAFPSSRKDIRTFARRAQFPIVVKNVDPWLRLSRRAVPGTTVVQNAQELLELSKHFAEPRSAMFQEYVPVDEAEDWIFHGYFDGTSNCLAPFTGLKLRSWPPRAGVTTYARIVRNEPLAEESIRLCQAIGYRGIVDLDWRLDKRDGRYKLVDFNPRVGAQFRMFENDEGLDVVRALHLDMSGRPVPEGTAHFGRGIMIENLDLPARIAYHGGHAAAPDGAALGPSPQRAWFAADDLMPFALMVVRFMPTVVARLATTVRQRGQRRAATAAAKRGAAKSVPQTKRSKGPKVPAADSPAKNSPGTDDSNDPASAGNPEAGTRSTRARKPGSRKSMASTSTR